MPVCFNIKNVSNNLAKINPSASFEHLAFTSTEIFHFKEHEPMLFMKTMNLPAECYPIQ